MKGIGRISDVIIAVLVIAITAMLLVPLPTFLIDILIVLNLSFALILLVVGLYLPNALALLSFPSLLLLTTLFRLSLNVASSRLILAQHNAGAVIDAFGTFLISGEILVGIIIFTIITIVNFIVIARGSARVSEVAARFVLDALPGKQATIDSDLRAGLLTPEQARSKREDLRKESQLFGSMDGAMKFVQGDAIAGIFIILTNSIGGLYLGVSHGMSFADAVRTYTVLTVGDGLVSQIPALLISICAGIVVTRVSSSENSTLGSDVGSQLFARPAAVIFAGVVLFLFGLLPVIPTLPFTMVGLCLVVAGYLIRRYPLQQPEVFQSARSDQLRIDHRGGALGLLQPEESIDDHAVTMHLDGTVLFPLYRMNSSRYQEWWSRLQGDFYNETGLRLPPLRVRSDEILGSATYRISYGDTHIEQGNVPLDNVLIEMNPSNAEAFGIEVSREELHPLSNSRVFWTYQSPALRRILESSNIRSFDFFEYASLRAAVFFADVPEEIFTASDVFQLLKDLEKKHPGLVSEGFSKHFVSISVLTEVFHELVRQGINVRDSKQIFEAVSAFCSANGITMAEQSEIPVAELTTFVRATRKRQILSGLLSERRTLKVLTLSPETENIFSDAVVPEKGLESRSGAPIFGPAEYEMLQRGIESVLQPLRERGLPPVTLLCRGDLRQRVAGFLRSFHIRLPVVGFEDLDSAVRIEQVGVWGA